jgi:ferredoxin
VTAALKNQYGLIPGAMKSQWHFRLQEADWLASLILDIHRTARPKLAIMDAVVAMEGAGPTSGTPRFMGALLASTDLVAVDCVACELIGQNPDDVPLLRLARQQGLGQTDLGRMAIFGDDWRSLVVPDFKRIERPVDVMRLLPLPPVALRWIQKHWTLQPRIVEGRCTRCGICEQGCPVRPPAIHPLAANGPKVEDARCIHCYCCHEFCPSHGIELREPWLARRLRQARIADSAGRLAGWLMRGRGSPP